MQISRSSFSRALATLWLATALCACSAIEASLYAAPNPSDSTSIRFTVPKGANASTLGARLANAGLISSEFAWKVYLKRSGKGACLKAGDFHLQKDMTANEVLETLCGVPLADEIEFTVLEGWRIMEIDEALAAKGLADAGAYTQLANQPGKFQPGFRLPSESLEGYLFPETYRVNPEAFDVERFIERQLETFQERFYTPNRDRFDARSLDEVVIMGSMVEREEPKNENAPMVAGILWKRLDSGWKLGVDATSRYTLEKWNDRRAFLKKLRDPADRYNTRLRGGLPPTAIGNAGLPALEAALNPTTSAYWYYLHDAKQNLHPAKSLRGHEANRKRYNVY